MIGYNVTEYNKEFSTPYDVTKLTETPAPGMASIEAFFTSKGNHLYAILQHWSGRRLLLKAVTSVKSVHFLGSDIPLKFSLSRAGVAVELPDLPESLRQQPAWVLDIQQ